MDMSGEGWESVPPCVTSLLHNLVKRVNDLSTTNNELQTLCKSQFEAISRLMSQQGDIVSNHMDRNDKEVEALQRETSRLETSIEVWKNATDSKIRDLSVTFNDKRAIEVKTIRSLEAASEKREKDMAELSEKVEALEDKIKDERKMGALQMDVPTVDEVGEMPDMRGSSTYSITSALPTGGMALLSSPVGAGDRGLRVVPPPTSPAMLLRNGSYAGSVSSRRVSVMSSINGGKVDMDNIGANAMAGNASSQQHASVLEYVDKTVSKLQQQIKQLRLNQEKSNRSTALSLKDLASSHKSSYESLSRKVQEGASTVDIRFDSLVADVGDIQNRVEEEHRLHSSKLRAMDENLRVSMSDCETIVSQLAAKIHELTQETIYPAKSIEKSLRKMQGDLATQKRELGLAQRNLLSNISKVHQKVDHQNKFVQSKMDCHEKEMKHRMNEVTSYVPAPQSKRVSLVDLSVTSRVQELVRRKKKKVINGKKKGKSNKATVPQPLILGYSSTNETPRLTSSRVHHIQPEMDAVRKGHFEVDFRPSSQSQAE